jgi:hypothetical protein
MAREHLLWNYPSLSCKIMLWLTKKKIAQRKIYLTLKCVYCWRSSMQIIPGNVWQLFIFVHGFDVVFQCPIYTFCYHEKNSKICHKGKKCNFCQWKSRKFVTRENSLNFCHKGKQSEILSQGKTVRNFVTRKNSMKLFHNGENIVVWNYVIRQKNLRACRLYIYRDNI